MQCCIRVYTTLARVIMRVTSAVQITAAAEWRVISCLERPDRLLFIIIIQAAMFVDIVP
jgi:hypothetical protein